MIFNSFTFLIFLIIVVTVYFWLPSKKRNFFLLAANYFFYMSWNAKYGLLLLSSTVVTYFAAILISRFVDKKKLVLIICVLFNIGLLFVFKYFNFTINWINTLFSHTGIDHSFSLLNIILPIGISFYIFQALGYVFDVYKNKVTIEKNFYEYALFVSFFPQLLSGPIGRSNQLLPQFKTKHTFSSDNAKDGLQLIIWGLFQKMVIANRLAIYVDRVYNNLGFFSTYEIAFATFLFAYQIYCDFAGYSNIAVGVAKMMGFDLIRNFNKPYLADSVGDFWHRWHISLSTWFKDYLYIPLGGSRVSKLRHKVNLMITFLVSGLWHGANWTYILWGATHGTGLVIETIIPFNSKNKILIPLHKFGIFLFVCFAWMFFRANNVSESFDIIRKLTIDASFSLEDFSHFISGIDFVTFNNVVTHSIINSLTLISLVLFIISQFKFKEEHIDIYFNKKDRLTRIVFNSILLMLIIFCGVFDSTNFIYFQF